MARRDDMDLMQLADGELDDAAREAAAAQVEGSADDQRKLQAIDQIGEVVRTHLELSAEEAEPRLAGLWTRIERGIHANGERRDPAATPVARPAPAPQPAGLLAGFRRWLDRHRAPVISGALAAGAVALLFVVLRPERVVEVPGPERERIVRVPAPVEALPAAVGQPAQVEELTVVGGTGSILTIPGEAGENDTTVIWIDPDEDMGGPI